MIPSSAIYRLFWALCCSLGVLALAGCQADGRPPARSGGGLETVYRFIEDDPERELRREELFESEPVDSWSFASEEDVRPWHLSAQPSEVAVTPRGLRLTPVRQYLTLTREVAIDADRVDAVELSISGLRGQGAAFWWSGEGQRFSTDRRVEVARGSRTHAGEDRFKFVTFGRPGWRGTVDRVRISFIAPRNGQVVVHGVSTVRERVSAEGLVSLGEPMKVDLGHDLRNAWVAIPGVPLTRTLTLPRRASLRFDYGVQQWLDAPVVFRVTAGGRGQREVLFEQRIEGGEPRWRAATVDLARFGGGEVELALEVEVEVEGGYDPRRGFPAWANVEVVAPAAAPLPPNVVLIVIDTLRADRLSLYGHRRQTSPRIDAWFGPRGVVFERAVAPAPWTLPAHVSLFTGLDALHHGVNYGPSAPRRLTMLAELLRELGYVTVAVTGGGFVHPRYGFAQGFDRYDSFQVRFGLENELESGIEEALAVLDREADRPLFLFFHTYEVHNPYRAREPFFSTFTGKRPGGVLVDTDNLPPVPEEGYLTRRELTRWRNGRPTGETLEGEEMSLAFDLYDSSIAYADLQIGRLLSRLDDLDLSRHTIVILTSDHGEAFGEHGAVNHYSVFDENVLVPLAIATPGSSRGARVGTQVRSVDILPTLLELVGSAPPEGIDGASLVPFLEEAPDPSHPSLAWSYVAASNYGVSVRHDNGGTYLFQNGAWPSNRPVELFRGAGSEALVPADEAAESSELIRLRETTALALERQLPGLRVRFSNRHGSRPFSGMIRGSAVGVFRAKLLRPPAGQPVSGEPGRLRFSVEPGESFTLALDDVPPDRPVVVVIDRDGVVRRFSTTIVPESLEGVQRVVPNGSGWVLEPGDASERDGLAIWWHRREEPGDGEAPAPLDEALREQLEALGYL